MIPGAEVRLNLTKKEVRVLLTALESPSVADPEAAALYEKLVAAIRDAERRTCV